MKNIDKVERFTSKKVYMLPKKILIDKCIYSFQLIVNSFQLIVNSVKFFLLMCYNFHFALKFKRFVRLDSNYVSKKVQPSQIHFVLLISGDESFRSRETFILVAFEREKICCKFTKPHH